MEAFTMEIAGAVIRVHPLFQSTREYCRPYLTDQDAEFCVALRSQDLVFEQMMLEREAVEEGLKIRKFKDPFLERASIQRRVADYLLDRNTLMLHGSTVAVDGRAYLFTGPCGTGKSTHTRFWRELFGERAVMVNDDKPFLQITSDCVLAYGSPWSGKHGLASNVCIPLAGICLLQRGRENIIHSVGPKDLLYILRKQVHLPADVSLQKKTLLMLDSMADMVPLWSMECTKELDAARVAYGAMRRE